jgi:excisionase family DNA binding protein
MSETIQQPQKTKVASLKSLLSLVTIIAVLCLATYGADGIRGLVVGVATSLASFVFVSVFQARTQVRTQFPRIAHASLFAGFLLGTSVSLGTDLSDSVHRAFNLSLVGSLAQGLMMGLFVGLLAWLIGRPEQGVRQQAALLGLRGTDFPYEPGFYTVLPASIGVVILLGAPFGVSEAVGGGLQGAVIVGVAEALLTMALLSVSSFGTAVADWLGSGDQADTPGGHSSEGGFFGHYGKGFLLTFGKMILPTSLALSIPFAAYTGLSEEPSTGISGGLAAGLSIGFGAGTGYFVGALAGYKLRPALEERNRVRPYLQAMKWPIAGYAIGFFAIVLIFASLLAATSSSGSLTGIPENTSFWNYVYFSLLVMTSLGAEGIQATTPWSKVLVSLEALTAITWTVIFFAAVIAYLEPRFTDTYDAETNKAIKDVEKSNKAIARQLVESIFSEETLDLTDGILAANYTFYDSDTFYVSESADEEHGYEEIRRLPDLVRKIFPDLQVTIADQNQIARGGYVVTHWVVYGVPEENGLVKWPAIQLGRPYKVSGTYLLRFVNDKIEEIWTGPGIEQAESVLHSAMSQRLFARLVGGEYPSSTHLTGAKFDSAPDARNIPVNRARNSAMNKGYYTIAEAALILATSEEDIVRMIQNGVLEAEPEGSSWKLSMSTVHEQLFPYLRQHEGSTASSETPARVPEQILKVEDQLLEELKKSREERNQLRWKFEEQQRELYETNQELRKLVEKDNRSLWRRLLKWRTRNV